jgi:AraC-like DNA-binding protein
MIRSLFKDYIKMYASRNERLTTRFSDCFSGYTGGGDFLVNDRDAWLAITRQDFAQVPDEIQIEVLDLLVQDLSDDVVSATALLNIRLSIGETSLARDAVRLSLVFRLEEDDWKITHSGISPPDHLVQQGEVYPVKGLSERNRELELLLKERTRELEETTHKLDALNKISHQVRQHLQPRLVDNPDLETVAAALNHSKRTLTRRLNDEGTSFLQIKDRLRRTISLQLLLEDKIPVDAIFVQLGFANLSTFHRSFKKWTGTSPQAYLLAKK